MKVKIFSESLRLAVKVKGKKERVISLDGWIGNKCSITQQEDPWTTALTLPGSSREPPTHSLDLLAFDFACDKRGFKVEKLNIHA